MPVTTPEYADLINQLTEQKKRALSTADAQAQGEAQRRGLVGQTGTSDIEMSLRGQKAAPIEQAYTGQIADTMTKLADQEAARKYQTSERLGSQAFQTGENTAQRGWQTGERVGSQGWQTGERKGSEGFTAGENSRDRIFRSDEANLADQRNTAENMRNRQWNTENRLGTQDWQDRNSALDRTWQNYLYQQQNNQLDAAQKKAAADWWKNPAGQILGNVGTSYINSQLGIQ